MTPTSRGSSAGFSKLFLRSSFPCGYLSESSQGLQDLKGYSLQNNKTLQYAVLCKRTYSYRMSLCRKPEILVSCPRKLPLRGLPDFSVWPTGHAGLSPELGAQHIHASSSSAAWEPSSLYSYSQDRTIPNHHSIKAAEIGWLGSSDPGKENQASSHAQASSFLHFGGLAMWLFLNVMAEGKDAWGSSCALPLDVPQRLERFQEQLLHVAREISRVTKPRLRPFPSGSTAPQRCETPGRRVHREAFLCDDVSTSGPTNQCH